MQLHAGSHFLLFKHSNYFSNTGMPINGQTK